MNKNYFDLHNEFFVISSDNLSDVTTRFYGYAIQDNGIFEQSNIHLLTEKLSGCGSYVYVNKNKDNITIEQDPNGSYGLYLFEHNKFFAISNSFMYLLDTIKEQYALEFNQDFANYMTAMGLCSEAVEETLVKSIRVLDKDATVNINTQTKKININICPPETQSLEIASTAGMNALDNWFIRWTKLFRNINTKNLTIELSGGFDSRLTFLLFLMSGIDFKTVKVVSSLNEIHKADFAIASAIAERYGFELNKAHQQSDSVNFCHQDLMNMTIYNRLPFHKEMQWKTTKAKYKFYTVTGSGGENIRSYWDFPIETKTNEYLRQIERMTSDCPKAQQEFTKSVLRITNKTYASIAKKHKTDDIPRYLYNETRSCRHFGSGAVLNFFANSYWLSPLLDPELLKLKLHDSVCNDNNLLIAVIFTRYCPQLLEFGFEGNRSIKQEIPDYAKTIIEKYPVDINHLLATDQDKQYVADIIDNDILDTVDTNPRLTANQLDEHLYSLFLSDDAQHVLSTHFNKCILAHAIQWSKNAKWYPLRQIYPLIADYMVLKSIAMYRPSKKLKRAIRHLFTHKKY